VKIKFESTVIKQAILNRGTKIVKEDDMFRRNLVNTINHYVKLIRQDNFRSP